ncbi:MAG: hypothetical protein ACKVT2_03170 [Saprospiraceae bacterium]
MKNFLFTRRSLGPGWCVYGFLIACILLGFLPNSLAAQKLNVWKGGQAGQATEWNCPRNWSLGKVPDWTCTVLIEQNYQHGNYPVISKPSESVGFLIIHPGARLEIKPTGSLEIEFPDALLLEGELKNHGQLILVKDTLAVMKQIAGFQ